MGPAGGRLLHSTSCLPAALTHRMHSRWGLGVRVEVWVGQGGNGGWGLFGVWVWAEMGVVWCRCRHFFVIGLRAGTQSWAADKRCGQVVMQQVGQ